MAVLLTVLTAAPFVDDTAAFAYVVPLVWCSRFFWPSAWSRRALVGHLCPWLVYLAPAACGAVVLLAVFPRLAGLGGGAFDLVDYLAVMGAAGAEYAKFDGRHIVWNAGNLLIPGLLPWSVADVLTPIADPPRLPLAALIGLGIGLAAATGFVHRRRASWSPYRKLGILMGIFIVFQSLVLLFHPYELSATGFYYGAIFSVLFAPFVAVVLTAAGGRTGTVGAYAARVCLVWALAMSAVNFIAINASWMAHSNSKTLESFPDLTIYRRWGGRLDVARGGTAGVLHATSARVRDRSILQRRCRGGGTRRSPRRCARDLEELAAG